MQTTWSDNDNSSVDDEDIVGKLVVHVKKLKLKDFDDERPKSSDDCPSCDLCILFHNIKISSMKSINEECNSEAKSSYDIDVVATFMSEAYNCMYSKWIK